MKSVIVFAYHNVGVRCLNVLLANPQIKILRIFSHEDNPNETIWFESVQQLAEEHHIPISLVNDINHIDQVKLIKELNPDFIFSFYYRLMLSTDILESAKAGAFNMHGSLLPKYRGRVPVNWAILHGETETGVTLHYMTSKPDQGDIVAQEKIIILPQDDAFTVFNRLTWAAEKLLYQILPKLIEGTHDRTPQNLAEGSYFSGRTPNDSEILWHKLNSCQIINLIRAVASPYPSAFCEFNQARLCIDKAKILSEDDFLFYKIDNLNNYQIGLFYRQDQLFAKTKDNKLLKIIKYKFFKIDKL